MQNFANNFITKNAGDISDFGIKLIDDKNKEIEFADGEKKIPYRNFFDWVLSMNRINKQKTKKQGRTNQRRGDRARKRLIKLSNHNTKKR